MNNFIRTFITVEKSIQIVALLGVVVFWGYLGLTSYQSQPTSSVPSILPTMQK
ncbi:hypothetical protein H6G41_19955 [Tolypothrix sp. FACHB-123]|uniref:hypothetical protein n=1 Tax=Tolypothrix sp. FACHB-123 TaxID=2692868 RepID=UPI001683A6D5|nr:hypothetical protein [Tolypothrix sp. FACHB-123]MBD2356873.1 hypothetical protein [Tolypothrix sp. FACHB-123]